MNGLETREPKQKKLRCTHQSFLNQVIYRNTKLYYDLA